MPMTDAAALEQIDVLLKEIEVLHSQSPYEDLSGGSEPAIAAVRVRALAAIGRLAPRDTAYLERPRTIDTTSHYPGNIVIELGGVLRGLRSDIEAGYLRTVEELVHADVFADFLEMADELLNKG